MDGSSCDFHSYRHHMKELLLHKFLFDPCTSWVSSNVKVIPDFFQIRINDVKN